MAARETRTKTESSTPLRRKLGLAPGMTVALLDAPAHLGELLGDLDAITVRRRLGGHPDVVLCFVRERAALTRRAGALRRAAQPDGSVWVCWPKQASKVPTDMTEGVVREVLLPTGLVDTKVAAIDATWSGLKLMVRRELR